MRHPTSMMYRKIIGTLVVDLCTGAKHTIIEVIVPAGDIFHIIIFQGLDAGRGLDSLDIAVAPPLSLVLLIR